MAMLKIDVALTGDAGAPFYRPDLRRLPAWLDRLADNMAKHEDIDALFMQEITGLRNWASIVRELLESAGDQR
jgi:hypothetical protein